jgi:hypothetical protein
MQALNQGLVPVVIFAYNRPEHLKRMLESLIDNPEFEDSAKYIFCDGPKANENLEPFKAVERLIDRYNLKNSEVVFAKQNLGLAKSITQGVSRVFEEKGHDRVMVFEDDLVLANDCLRFMNEMLSKYESDYQYAGVSAYSYGAIKPLRSQYSLPIGGSWGWGTWKRAWKPREFESRKLLKRIEPKKAKFDFGNYPFYETLLMQANGEIDSWAICFYASFFLRSQRFIFPPQSLVANGGMDESGTHGVDSDYLAHKELGKWNGSLRDEEVDSTHAEQLIHKAFQSEYGSSSIFARTLKKINPRWFNYLAHIKS